MYLNHEVNCTFKFNTFHISLGYQVQEINDVILNLKYSEDKGKDWLLGFDTVTQVKISLYEDGIEAAWVIFDKQSGSNDN